MNIKILSKINIFLTEFVVFSKMVFFCYFKNFFTKFLLILGLFTTGIGFFIILFSTIFDAHILIDDLLCQVIFYLSTIYFLTFIISLLLFLIGDIILEYINKYFYLNISLSKINTVSYLFVRNHTSSKLNLEIEKLSRAFDNKSNIYRNLSETDFPYINKFIRRALRDFHVSTKDSSSIKKLELISPIDIGKLKMCPHDTIPVYPILLKFHPNLLTLDVMDNELNNIIHNQMKNLNKEKVELD